MNTHIALSKIRGFNLGPRFDKHRTQLDLTSYNNKQLGYAKSKLFRTISSVVERKTHLTDDQLFNDWVKLGCATVFALFYKHD